MIEFYSYLDIPDNFTGTCKIIGNGNIVYLKNGLSHREDGPAIIYKDGYTVYCYNGLSYGYNSFTNESWKEKVKELKYLESLEIFK